MAFNALAIESRPGNFTVLARFLEKMDIKAVHLQKLSDIDEVLDSVQPFSVAIIDLMGYDDSVWDCCKSLRRRGIPMLIISPSNDQKVLQIGYAHGAKGVFKKPVLMAELAECLKLLITQG